MRGFEPLSVTVPHAVLRDVETNPSPSLTLLPDTVQVPPLSENCTVRYSRVSSVSPDQECPAPPTEAFYVNASE